MDWQDPEWGYATALHRAVQERQEQAAEYLLECKANVEMVDQSGFTALHYAAQTQEDVSGLMSKLLQAGGRDAATEPSRGGATGDRWQDIKTI